MGDTKDLMNMSLSDMESSVLISDEETTPTKVTPASKRKRDEIIKVEREERREILGISGLDESSTFLQMERESPEPRRKNPLDSSPSKPLTGSKDTSGVPDVVGEIDIDNNLPETVTLLKTKDGSKIYVIGTAHFSQESQEDVSNVIRAVQPHCVVVELCFARTDIIRCDEKAILEAAKNINFQSVMALMRKNGAVQGLLYLTLLTMSAHVTRELGMAPGGEFRTAYREASKIPKCMLILGDRAFSITIARALSSLSWWQCIKLFCNLVFSKDPIKKEDVERCKQRDLLEAMLAELAGEFPGLKEVLVTERDKYLTYSLQNAVACGPAPRRVVGVVGIGHVPGIKKFWGEVTEEEVARLMTVPPPSRTSRILKFTVRGCLIGGAIYGIYKIAPIPYNKVFQFFRPLIPA